MTYTSKSRINAEIPAAAAIASVTFPLFPETACSDCPGALRFRKARTPPA